MYRSTVLNIRHSGVELENYWGGDNILKRVRRYQYEKGLNIELHISAFSGLRPPRQQEMY